GVGVVGGSARLARPRAPGRTLAVLGTQTDEACAVLGAAAISLSRQFRPGEARFSIACLDPDAEPAADAAFASLAALSPRWYDQDSVTELLADVAADLHGPHFLLLYAVHAVASRVAAHGANGA